MLQEVSPCLSCGINHQQPGMDPRDSITPIWDEWQQEKQTEFHEHTAIEIDHKLFNTQLWSKRHGEDKSWIFWFSDNFHVYQQCEQN